MIPSDMPAPPPPPPKAIKDFIESVEANESWSPPFPSPGETPELRALAACRTWEELEVVVGRYFWRYTPELRIARDDEWNSRWEEIQ